MAGFRTHVTTSTLLGCGYAGAGHMLYDVPLETSLVAGALCGFSGMLPDIDSDRGVPLRETMAFMAAVAPMLLMAHFEALALSHDAMVLVAVSIYLFVRFGVAQMIRKYTVHRGMFHSIPAGLVFAGLAFLSCGCTALEIRLYKAGGVMAGFLSHLILDELYSIEWKGGRWRFKRSFGTALKFWGDDAWSNFSTYAKLAIVAMLIAGEPSVMAQLESRHPRVAGRVQHWHDRLDAIGALPGSQQAEQAWESLMNTPQHAPFPHPTAPLADQPEAQRPFPDTTPLAPATIRSDYDAARRSALPWAQ